jgi:hypothetical protein
VKIIASLGALQTQPLMLPIVQPPTALLATSKLVDTLVYTLTPTARDTTLPLSVRLVHVRGTDTLSVPSYLVRYAFEHPAGFPNDDTTRIQLVNDNKKGSLVDTTAAGSSAATAGVASRSLRITPFVSSGSDSVVLLVSARRPDASPVPGSPVRFVVHYTVK